MPLLSKKSRKALRSKQPTTLRFLRHQKETARCLFALNISDICHTSPVKFLRLGTQKVCVVWIKWCPPIQEDIYQLFVGTNEAVRYIWVSVLSGCRWARLRCTSSPRNYEGRPNEEWKWYQFIFLCCCCLLFSTIVSWKCSERCFPDINWLSALWMKKCWPSFSDLQRCNWAQF